MCERAILSLESDRGISKKAADRMISLLLGFIVKPLQVTRMQNISSDLFHTIRD